MQALVFRDVKIGYGTKGRLLQDIDNDPVLQHAINANPELVDAWKVLDKAGIDQAVRRKPGLKSPVKTG